VVLLQDHGAEVRAHVLTDVVPFDDAPAVFAELSERRRPVISVAFEVAP
jgi:hypothetical protein